MNLTQFLEGSERVLPVLPTNPNEKQKGLAKRDVGKQAAFKTVTGKSFTDSDIRGELDPEPGLEAQRQAKVMAATKVPGGTPRGVRDRDAGFQGSEEDAAAVGDVLAGGLQARMKQAVDTGDPRALTGDYGKNQAANAEIRAGEGEKAIEPFTTDSGVEVTSKSGMRHNYQPVSDMGYDSKDKVNFPDASDGSWPVSMPYEHPEDGRKWYYNPQHDDWNPELTADDVTNMVGLNMDPLNPEIEVYYDKEGKLASRVNPASTQGGENPQNPNASAAEIEYFTQNPEGVKMLAALDAGDTEAVQQLAFSQYVGKEGETHEAVDEYLRRTKQSGMRISERGLTTEKKSALYGGKIDNKFADEFMVKEKGAPEGIYNLNEIKKAAGDKSRSAADRKELQKLHDQILDNREYEAVRTYLKQNGQDAYVPWEGQRSLQQLNLEHIKALKGTKEKGWDHPGNWTWASEPLNTLKSNRALGQGIESNIQGKKSVLQPGKGFKQFAKRAAELTKQTPAAIDKLIRDTVPEIGMDKEEYLSSMNADKVTASRENLQRALADVGAKISAYDLEKLIPDVRIDKAGYEDLGSEGYDAERQEQETYRLEKDGLLSDLKKKHGQPQFGNIKKWPAKARAEAEAALLELERRRDIAKAPRTEIDDALGGF